MRLVRYTKDGTDGCGILDGELVQPVADTFHLRPTGAPFPLSGISLLAPCLPTKIICAGLNYKDHAAEMGMQIPDEPVIFMKPPTSVLAPGGVIRYPAMSRQLDYEGELGVVIGKTARGVSPGEAKGHILGYTCFNDVTARDLQRKDGQWTRAKSFDTFSPFGPWIETEMDPTNALVETYLNGVRRQGSSTSNMKYSVFDLVSFISQVMTLLPGDVIATGTPPGIGSMNVGDEIEVRVSGIGSLKNTVGK